MRNIVIAILVGLGLVWLFFSSIFVGFNQKNTVKSSDSKITEIASKQDVAEVDIKNMALLFGVDYLEEADVEEVVRPNTIDVELEIVVIYTSKDNHKVRIRKTVDGEKTQFDMVLDDELYGYILTTINPSSVELDNGENNITLKIFKTTIMSVTDLPKEVSDSL